jgi:hypothetical protein
MPKGIPKNAKPKVIRTNDLPSSVADQKKLLKMIREASDATTMIAAQRDKLNDVKANIQEEFPITVKLMNKLIDFEYRQNFDQVYGEWEEIAHAHEKLVTAGEAK